MNIIIFKTISRKSYEYGLNSVQIETLSLEKSLNPYLMFKYIYFSIKSFMLFYKYVLVIRQSCRKINTYVYTV